MLAWSTSVLLCRSNKMYCAARVDANQDAAIYDERAAAASQVIAAAKAAGGGPGGFGGSGGGAPFFALAGETGAGSSAGFGAA